MLYLQVGFGDSEQELLQPPSEAEPTLFSVAFWNMDPRPWDTVFHAVFRLCAYLCKANDRFQ
jgi:hypothetical protein